jgi:hypothetical protein
MNGDALKSMLGQITTAVLAILVATGVMTNEQTSGVASAVDALFTSASAAIPAVLLLINVAASIYRHWGQKKVPEASIALILPPQDPKPVVGTTINLGPLKGNAKVVG